MTKFGFYLNHIKRKANQTKSMALLFLFYFYYIIFLKYKKCQNSRRQDIIKKQRKALKTSL